MLESIFPQYFQLFQGAFMAVSNCAPAMATGTHGTAKGSLNDAENKPQWKTDTEQDKTGSWDGSASCSWAFRSCLDPNFCEAVSEPSPFILCVLERSGPTQENYRRTERKFDRVKYCRT